MMQGRLLRADAVFHEGAASGLNPVNERTETSRQRDHQCDVNSLWSFTRLGRAGRHIIVLPFREI